jgi:RNA polymerase sigma-32 factor
VSAVAKDLNVSEREVMEMESRLSGRDIGFDAPTDEDNEHAPPSPAAFLVANDEDPSMAYERADSEDNQMQLLREAWPNWMPVRATSSAVAGWMPTAR